jgi:hypothetical protein
VVGEVTAVPVDREQLIKGLGEAPAAVSGQQFKAAAAVRLPPETVQALVVLVARRFLATYRQP